VTVATAQTLFNLNRTAPSRLKDTRGKYQFLIIDEAHRSGAFQFHTVSGYCENAFYRIALTATPFMAGNPEDDLYLMGFTGPTITQVTPGELIARGVLAQPFFRFCEVNQPDLPEVKGWRDIYEAGIVRNTHRNGLVVDQAKALSASAESLW